MSGESATDSPAELRPRRSARMWLILLIAWGIGLLIWAAYIAAYVYAVFRVLT